MYEKVGFFRYFENVGPLVTPGFEADPFLSAGSTFENFGLVPARLRTLGHSDLDIYVNIIGISQKLKRFLVCVVSSINISFSQDYFQTNVKQIAGKNINLAKTFYDRLIDVRYSQLIQAMSQSEMELSQITIQEKVIGIRNDDPRRIF